MSSVSWNRSHCSFLEAEPIPQPGPRDGLVRLGFPFVENMHRFLCLLVEQGGWGVGVVHELLRFWTKEGWT